MLFSTSKPMTTLRFDVTVEQTFADRFKALSDKITAMGHKLDLERALVKFLEREVKRTEGALMEANAE